MKVTFSSKYSVFAVQAEAGTLVSLTSTPATVDDGIYTVGDSGVVIVDEGIFTDSIYLSTTGTDYTVDRSARIATVAEGVQVWAGTSAISCPFRKKSKGGDDYLLANYVLDNASHGMYFLIQNTNSVTDIPIKIGKKKFMAEHSGKSVIVQTAGENSSDFVDTTLTTTGYNPIYVKGNPGDVIKVTMSLQEAALYKDNISIMVARQSPSPENTLLLTTAGENIVNDGGRTWYKTNDGKAIMGMYGTNYIQRVGVARTNEAADISGSGGNDVFYMHFIYNGKEYYAREHYQYSYQHSIPPTFTNDYGHVWFGPESGYTSYQLAQLAEMAGIEL